MIDQREITTERLLLRRPRSGDEDAIVSIVGDWQVARRLARVPHPYGAADAAFFLDQVVSREWVWAIVVHGSDDLVGTVGLMPDGGNTAELGYWLSPPLWGQGVATEAARAVVDHGFDVLGLAELTSGYFEDNPASGRVLRKLGFIETHRLPRPCLATGGMLMSIRMRLPGPGSGGA